MTDMSDIRRKRLLFRSWHRGTKESDLLLGSLAEPHLAAFSDAQLDLYEALLDNDDGDLFDWITGRGISSPGHDGEIMRMLQNFKYTARPA